MSGVRDVLKTVEQRNPGEPEFLQAVREILETLDPVLARHPEYEKAGILDRLVEPERQLIFECPGRTIRGVRESTGGFVMNSTVPLALTKEACASIRACARAS